ncbi:MAG: efflux transporter outer membrane subunit [Parasphingorhabdus sp.]|uniref:efflux transporter outer membrane subunit n=1 Tax=Parasphingorhabdus sp. TaxID=2709688 RepID=UPI0030031007
MMSQISRSIIIAALFLAGCTRGPDYHPHSTTDLAVPDEYVGGNDGISTADISEWWSRFNDPVLEELIDTALSENLDLAQSVARVTQARESLVQSGADQLPAINFFSSSGRNFNSDAPDSWSFSRSIDASWSADIFGGLKRSKQATFASYQSAGYSLANVRTLIAAELARNYVSARSLQDRLRIAEESLRNQESNLQIAKWRAQAGLVSSVDVEQAKAQRAQTAAIIPLLEQSKAAARYRLAVLTGQAPGAVDGLLDTDARLPAVPEFIAKGAPADILRQRPDILSSERDLAAATARIGVAQAQLFPSLTLTGNIGSISSDFGNLTDILTGGLFASIAHSIFDAGSRRSAVRSQVAAADGAFAAYRSAILNALEEVENAAKYRRTAEARISAFSDQSTASNNAAILTRANYRAGLIDFQRLLESERSLLSANDSLAIAQADRLTSAIQLYLALGGGWQSVPQNANNEEASK